MSERITSSPADDQNKEASREKIKSQELVLTDKGDDSDRNLPEITTTTLDSLFRLENRKLNIMEGRNKVALQSIE